MSCLKNNRFNKTSINVNINTVLTPKTCSSIIVEFIKLLAYQRLQIPYNFERLKYVVDKKKNKNKIDETVNESWHSSAYFKTTSTALDVLESIFKNIHSEFQDKNVPQEVCILLGPNILCAKEIYRIIVPKSLNDHFHENHIKDSQNLIHFVLRYLVCSEELQKCIYSPSTLTNFYVLIKKSANNSNIDAASEQLTSEFFLPLDSFNVPSKIPETVINLEYKPSISLNSNCCKNMKIFNDSTSNCSENSEVISDSKFNASDSTETWFQANVHLKGFQASFVNGQSVSDSWIK